MPPSTSLPLFANSPCVSPSLEKPLQFPSNARIRRIFSKNNSPNVSFGRLVTRILRTKYRREKKKTPLFSTTHRQFSRNPEIGANYSQIAYDIHLYRKKEKKKRENYEGNITILHRFQPFTFLTHATSFPTNFSRAKKSQRRKKENIRVTILTASLPYFK